MTPAARLAAVIDILTAIDAEPRPADAVIAAYLRGRRYIGAKDRQAVVEAAYATLRRRGRLGWSIDKAGGEPTPRLMALANTLIGDGQALATATALFSGKQYAPSPLEPHELAVARRLSGMPLSPPEMPASIRLECPDWAEAGLRETLGDGFEAELKAMLSPAPLDLRANRLVTTRSKARTALAEAGIEADPTDLSPDGLRLRGRIALGRLAPFADGLIEVQDEGSQAVALIADARPGHQVLDLCAGAGGKTLALAATMANKGRVVATDVLAGRLDRARTRFRRAGAHNIETRALGQDGDGARSQGDKWLKRARGHFDRVLVDAPCSGTGTWRRNPDQRWRQLGPGLSELIPLQASLLDKGAAAVKPGGRLIYATCSLLLEENDHQVEGFLARHPDFAAIPAQDVWAEAVDPDGGHALPACPRGTAWLRLWPGRHGTDGFFAAVLERRQKG